MPYETKKHLTKKKPHPGFIEVGFHRATQRKLANKSFHAAVRDKDEQMSREWMPTVVMDLGLRLREKPQRKSFIKTFLECGIRSTLLDRHQITVIRPTLLSSLM